MSFSVYLPTKPLVEAIQDAPETSLLVSRLSQEKLSAALWFSTTLAEEVEKVDGNNIKQ